MKNIIYFNTKSKGFNISILNTMKERPPTSTPFMIFGVMSIICKGPEVDA
jgi:hypothetical protein